MARRRTQCPPDDLEHLVAVRTRVAATRQAAIVHTIRELGADVIGLQEVWGTAETSQAHEFAEALGMHAAFATPATAADPGARGERGPGGCGDGAGPGQPLADHGHAHRRDALATPLARPGGDLRAASSTRPARSTWS